MSTNVSTKEEQLYYFCLEEQIYLFEHFKLFDINKFNQFLKVITALSAYQYFFAMLCFFPHNHHSLNEILIKPPYS